MDTKEFIEKSVAKHGDVYDYSKVNFINRLNKVIIICKKHGEFEQLPGNHLAGKGCPECSKLKRVLNNPSRVTQEVFEERMKKLYGDKLDFTHAKVVRVLDKVPVICKKHGEFLRKPSELMRGRGCPKCGAEKARINGRREKRTTKDFIQLLKNKFGDRFLYDKVEYKNNVTKVHLTCLKHGEFTNTPKELLKPFTYGCQECAKDKTRLTLDSFKERAKEVHKGKYDYSNITHYKSQEEIIELTCTDHNVHKRFKVSIKSHLAGAGCRFCRNKRMRKSQEEFIEKAKEIHGNKYDYSRVVYNGNTNKVIVGCDKHPKKYWFKVSPDKHTHKSTPTGCTLCTGSKGEQVIGNYLIDNDIEFEKAFIVKHDGKLYKYDFMLPDYNLIIELHGIFHFQVQVGLTTEEDLRKVEENDYIKEQWALNNNYQLLVLDDRTHCIKEEDIKRILTKYLNKTNKKRIDYVLIH